MNTYIHFQKGLQLISLSVLFHCVIYRFMRQTARSLALLAVVFHLLAQVSILWLPRDGSTIQICTTQGVQTIALAAQDVPDHEPTVSKDHCPFCMVRTVLFTGQDETRFTTVALQRTNVLPSFYQTPVSYDLTTPHNPRAPPVFS